MSEENKPNYEEAIKRTYYVLWAVWCLYVYRDMYFNEYDDEAISIVIATVIPYFPFMAAKWIYSGYKKVK